MTGSLAILRLSELNLIIRISDTRKLLVSPASQVTPEAIKLVLENRQRIVLALTPVEWFSDDVTIWDCDRHRPWDDAAAARSAGRIAPDPLPVEDEPAEETEFWNAAPVQGELL